MKSKVLIGMLGGLFTIVIFFCGFMSAIYLNLSSLSSSYTKEHVDNGRFMLYALKSLEEGNVEQAKLSLRGHVSAKVFIVDAVRLPPTNSRELQLINDFLSEVVHYFESQGGFNETMQIMENGEWATKPTPSMTILENFSAREHKKALEVNE